MADYTSAKKDHSPAGGPDRTKCAFIIKGSCKNSKSSSFEYDRSTPDAPGSEHMSSTIMPGSTQNKEMTARTTTNEAQHEDANLADAPAGAEDTTILERRLARTLGTEPVPRSQASSDRMLGLHDSWSTNATRNPENLVAFRGTKNDSWNTQLPVRPRTGSVNSGILNTVKVLGDPAPTLKKKDNSTD